MSREKYDQQKNCGRTCCDGTEILCLSIPCPATLVLLGLELNLELQCLRLTSVGGLTADNVAGAFRALGNLLGALGASMQQEQKES
jgi:hypothetical protein